MNPKLKTHITSEQIQSKVKHLAQEVHTAYQHARELHVVIVLQGAKIFADDLLEEIRKRSPIKIKEHSIQVSSYGDTTSSSGKVRLKQEVEGEMEGSKVLIIEDIVETGFTIDFVHNYLRENKRPASIEVATFLHKPCQMKVDVKPDYVGFVIPPTFVVRYGLDYAGQYRDLPYIATGEF